MTCDQPIRMPSPHLNDDSGDMGDPLLAAADLPLRMELYPLGFPLIVESNSAAIVRAAEASWGCFAPAFDKEAVVLNLGVLDRERLELPEAPVIRSRRHLLSIVSDAHNFITCDFNGGFHFGWVESVVANDQAFLSYYFLDVAVQTMLQQRYLAPIHGACVARGNRGVLLCGPSEAGKSTLAYACALAGWAFVADDASFLIRSQQDRQIIGNCHSIRLREQSKQLFRDLRHLDARQRANGTKRIEVPTRNLDIATRFSCVVEHIVFINRTGVEEPHIQRCSDGESALRWFSGVCCYGSEEVRHEQMESYRRLSHAATWEMHYRDPQEAVSLLNSLR